MITNKEKTFISAVVYVHNHQHCIEEFLLNINDCLSKNFERFEIICVNDFSKDKSEEIIREFSKQYIDAPVSVLNMSYYQGVEASVLAGVDIAIGDFVFEFDNPFVDYSVDEIINVYKKCLMGFDIVSVSPNKKLKFRSRLFYLLFNYNRNSMPIKTESFRILSRRAINRIAIISDNIIYRKAVYYNCGLKCENITYETLCKNKCANRNLKYEHRLALDALIYFTNIGVRVSFVLALIMMVFSVFGLSYTIYVYLFLKHPIEGWTTLMLFLSFGFLGLFVLIAILIKYAALILEVIHKKQKYMFESIHKVNKN